MLFEQPMITMKREMVTLSVSELREWFNRETKLFITALEKGAPWQELQKLKDKMRNISLLIEDKSSKESSNQRLRTSKDPGSH